MDYTWQVKRLEILEIDVDMNINFFYVQTAHK